MSKDHESSRLEHFLVVPGSPVPGEPFEILRIDELKFVQSFSSSVIVFVPAVSVRTLSIFIFSSLDAVNNCFV